MRQHTVDVYNSTARDMARKFRAIGPRVTDIKKAVELAKSTDKLSVIEIGCGDGRDAKEIVARVDSYLGFDISQSFIEMSREYVPETSFEVADTVTYMFPRNIDIVFAFASLLHLSKEEMAIVFAKISEALRVGGIFYISLKAAPEYTHIVQTDEFGEREFYFYSPENIQQISGKYFETVFLDKQYRAGVKHKDWFTIALKKK